MARVLIKVDAAKLLQGTHVLRTLRARSDVLVRRKTAWALIILDRVTPPAIAQEVPVMLARHADVSLKDATLAPAGEIPTGPHLAVPAKPIAARNFAAPDSEVLDFEDPRTRRRPVLDHAIVGAAVPSET